MILIPMGAIAALQQLGQQAQFESAASKEAALLKDESDQSGRSAGVVTASFVADWRVLNDGDEVLFSDVFGRRYLFRWYRWIGIATMAWNPAFIGL